ncbi:TIGR01777 family oxidoreductase [Mucilaginibacter agri]|uniref:TIGR01777 family protein n=1 Tax=Mucilaginibacter agri TaxID=2695265 RepID=A0A965ZI66_9SPHI|nr:TIGR01777 family oxidoreductase [Mucilaginibacter agri]NCD71538.1 TIGR01777 family protein [Mucilaginibacter agri]
MQQQHILITGGSGLIGKNLTKQLLAEGYTVSHLSRGKGKDSKVKTYQWNVEQGKIDEHCLDGVDTIVHLAGAGIADKRWTKKRKKLLIDSRTQSIGLIYELMKRRTHQVKNIISASATGYYSDRGDELLTEESPVAKDFLGYCCLMWEQAVDQGKQLGLRVIKLRTGVVLSTQGGALPPLAFPIKLGIGTALGTGKQWIPWVHIQDAIDMYLHVIKNQNIQGVYNMVAPNPVTNKQLTKAVAKQLRRPYWMPNVPSFALKLLLGEMSLVVLGSTRVSPEKIEENGFIFQFPEITAALKDLYA